MLDIERRRETRVEMRELDARVTTADRELHVRVADLSLGGARLRGSVPQTAGQHVGVAMRLEQRDFALVGTVAWQSAQPAYAGVAFDSLDVPTRRALVNAMIAASVFAEQSAAHGANILLMLGDSVRQLAAARELIGRGYRPLSVATPLEAVQRLDEGSADIRIAIVSCDLPANAGQDVLAFLADEYPAIQRVVLDSFDGSRDADTIANALALASCNDVR